MPGPKANKGVFFFECKLISKFWRLLRKVLLKKNFYINQQ